MAKLAGGIDATVRFIEAVIQTQPTLKFQSVAGKELAVRDLAGLARSIQAASSVPEGRAMEQSDLQDLEKRFAAIEADAKTMIAQLASATRW
jgi:hypothetical protein